ncbi:hypothetical protein ACFXGA_09690 [Actinosynnema sp. NPDC059335]|uniref:hypothetical protein n=1 Tax=Actinosynnema sp. NPDC059335 TaxID=3346804 RepID=UPI00366B31D1
MTSTHPLLVPITVDALAVTTALRTSGTWNRWQADFDRLKRHQDPETIDDQQSFGSKDYTDYNGVYLMWQLPQALRSGPQDPKTGRALLPKIPNRWLVLRHPGAGGPEEATAAWVVESDYTGEDGTSSFIIGQDATLIGRSHPLQATGEGWQEERAADPLFLDAFGPGLAGFTLYQRYNENVLSLHDPMTDLPAGRYSYLVVGWYSNPDGDPLSGKAPVEQALAALKWRTEKPLSGAAVLGSRYVGTALAVAWDDPDHCVSSAPDYNGVKVAFGQSWADAQAALTEPEVSGLDAEEHLALTAFHHDTLPDLGKPDAERLTALERHQRTFARAAGGGSWQWQPSSDDKTGHSEPDLSAHNAAQAELDAAQRQLEDAQHALFDLDWLRKSHQITAEEYQTAHSPRAAERDQARARVDLARKALPPAPAEAVSTPDDPFYEPMDPVVLLSGTKITEPLVPEAPLCRTYDRTVTGIAGHTLSGTVDSLPGYACLAAVCGDDTALAANLFTEFAVLDAAARTPKQGEEYSDLQWALDQWAKGRHELITGIPADFTRPWPGQPWLPRYLLWTLACHPIAYQDTSGQSPHWSLHGNELRWNGEGEVGESRPTVSGFSLITPLPQFASERRARHWAANTPPDEAEQWRRFADQKTKEDALCQALTGVNAWFQQRSHTHYLADENEPYRGTTVPDSTIAHFFPVRSGQADLQTLSVVDAFGQTVELINPGIQRSTPVYRSPSTRPHPNCRILDDIQEQYVLQFPPRILHRARLRFDPVDARTDAPVPPIGPPGGNPVCGWLLPNHLDRTLVVFGPDGTAFGQIQINRNSGGTERLAWRALPPRQPTESLATAATALPGPLGALLTAFLQQDATALPGLMALIDEALHTQDRYSHEHDNQAVLMGRPLAVVRAALRLELDGACPAGAKGAVDPPATPPLTTYRWQVRLGLPELAKDGLVGYFGPDLDEDATRYDRLWTSHFGKTAGYLRHLGAGEQDPGLLLTAGSAQAAKPEHGCHVTLLLDPWRSAAALSDLLPAADLTLDQAVVRPALTRMRVPFPLGPLLAPDGPPVEAGSLRTVVMPRPVAWTGEWEWVGPPAPRSADQGWDRRGITPSTVTADPQTERPPARSGFLRNIRGFLPDS